MGHFSVEIMRLPGQLSVEINSMSSSSTMATNFEAGLSLDCSKVLISCKV